MLSWGGRPPAHTHTLDVAFRKIFMLVLTKLMKTIITSMSAHWYVAGNGDNHDNETAVAIYYNVSAGRDDDHACYTFLLLTTRSWGQWLCFCRDSRWWWEAKGERSQTPAFLADCGHWTNIHFEILATPTSLLHCYSTHKYRQRYKTNMISLGLLKGHLWSHRCPAK